MDKILHYMHDPLCGWCYAAERLTDAVSARGKGQFDIQLHAGGLFPRTHLPAAKRSHIRIADARIGELTGQVFGDPYLHGLLDDPNTVYDSAMPIRGILAADTLEPGGGMAMLKALQRAHYRRGLRIVEAPTIADVAAGIGLNKTQFAAVFDGITDVVLQEHLDSTRRLMHAVGARGFPTFVVQIGNEFQPVPHERFYGDPNAFADLVSNMLAPQGAVKHADDGAATSPNQPGRCDGESCAV